MRMRGQLVACIESQPQVNTASALAPIPTLAKPRRSGVRDGKEGSGIRPRYRGAAATALRYRAAVLKRSVASSSTSRRSVFSSSTLISARRRSWTRRTTCASCRAAV